MTSFVSKFKEVKREYYLKELFNKNVLQIKNLSQQLEKKQ